MVWTFFTAGGLFLGLLLSLEAGRRFGKYQISKNNSEQLNGIGTVEGAVFGLLGLLVAFTFSGAAVRFDGRRDMITEEANAIGTAYLRLDLLAPEPQAELKKLFVEYLDARLITYKTIGDTSVALKHYAHSVELQNEIWKKSVAACKDSNSMSNADKLLMPALNDMIDITTTRLTAARKHPPSIVFILLYIMSLMSALLAGFSMAKGSVRPLLHMIVLAAILSFTVFVILDLEYPRLGIIRIDQADRVLYDLRNDIAK